MIPVSGMEVTSIGRKRRIAIYDYSTTPGEPEMVISSKSQYMPSDWFSYCTLKPSILLKIVLRQP